MHHIPVVFRIVFGCRAFLSPAVWAVCAVFLGSGTLQAAIIRFYESAEVDAPVVTLGDVADIRDNNPERVARLEKITLMPAPSVGNSEQIGFATIRSRLQAQGVNLARIEFSGNSVIRVTAFGRREGSLGSNGQSTDAVSNGKVRRAERNLKKAIGQYLRSRASGPGQFELSVRIPEEHVPQILAADPSRLRIEGGKPPWDEPQTFLVRISDQAGMKQSIQVACRIAPHPRVPALRHAVPRGHVLKRGDLTLRQVDNPRDAVTRLEDVLGRETKRTLRRGDTIARDDIREVPLIRSNDIVTVYARSGGIVVRRQLKARADGAKGDTVKLVTLDGRETVLGRVVGFHEAEVIGAGSPTARSRNDADNHIRFVPGK